MKDEFKWAVVVAAVFAGIYAGDFHNRVRFVDDKFERAARWRDDTEAAAKCFREAPDPCGCMVTQGANAHAVRCYEKRGRKVP